MKCNEVSLSDNDWHII